MNNILCVHNPDEENGWMSNWYPSFFELGGFSFSSLEQYMMYSKATLFEDFETARKILAEENVAKI